jgi:PAS domain S-box-containing protein
MAILDKAKAAALGASVAAFALALIVSFWSGAYLLGQQDLARTLADIDNENRNLARTLAEHAGRTLDYADRIALQIKAGHEQSGGRFDLLRFGAAGSLDRKLILAIAITDARGDILQVDTLRAGRASYADRDHFLVHANADSGKPYVSRPLLGRTLKGRPVIALTRRLNRPDGKFDGVVVVGMDPAAFTAVYRDLGLGDQGLIALSGVDGFVRARNSGGLDEIGQDVRKGPLYPEYSARAEGATRFASVVDGITRRVAFRRLDNYPLSMLVGVAEEKVLVAVHARQRTLYAGAAGASLLAALAVLALALMLRRRERDAVALRESEARYRRMLDTLPDAVIIRHGEKITYVNAAALRLLGATTPDQLLGKSPLEYIHPDYHARARELFARKAVAGEFITGLEQKYRRFDGSLVDVETVGTEIREDGVSGRQVVARDITERKRVEAMLRDSMDRYRRMVESFPDAVFINRDDRIVYANAAALRLLGADNAGQVVGKSPLEIVHADDRDAVRQRIEKALAGIEVGGLREQRYLRFDGGVVDTEVSVSSVIDEGAVSRQVVVRDVSARKRFEAELRENERRYRLLVESAPDAILIYEGERVAYANPAAVRLLGAADMSQVVGSTLFDLIDPAGQAAALARREFVRKTGQSTGLFEQVYLRFDGGRVWVEGSSTRVPGPLVQRQVVLRDISARKRAEAALHESEARLRMAVEAAGMSNWEWDIASDQTHWGLGHEKLLGPLPAGRNRYPDFREMVHADDRERFLAAGRATIEHGTPYDIEFRLTRTDGVVRWMRHTGRALRDAHGVVEGMAGVMQDVTRRHEVEQELAESRQRRDALMDSIPAPAWLKDRAGRFVAVNRAWYERFKMDPRFAIGRTNSEVFPGPFAVDRDREDLEVMRNGHEVRTERQSRVDGLSSGWFQTVKTPIFDDNGEVCGIVGISHDITERRQTEERLRASEERFRQFADSVDDVFWIIEPAPQRFVYVNQAFTRIWGVPVEELLADARLWGAAVHPDDAGNNLPAFERWLQDPALEVYAEEYRVIGRDGRVHWIRDHGTKLRDAAGNVVRLQGIAEDITQRREAELALLESQQRRDALLESNPEPSWLKDGEGRYLVANRAWFRRRGVEPHDIAGMTDAAFFDAERCAIIEAEDRQVIATGMLVRSERNWNYADGATWIETVKSPVRDGRGRITGIIGISHDISARKRNEQAVLQMNKSLEQQTIELTALNRELEAFAYTVSHDLRAPLRHIDGFVNLLKLHAGATLDAQSTRYFERVVTAARRMGLLIDDLLAFSRTGRAELRMQRVALDRVLRDTIAHLAPDTRERNINWQIGALPAVRGDAALLAIVFQNLVGNAVKYTRRRAAAQIEISAVSSREAGTATIAVRDNGVGFDMQYRNKLFGVFQRLHTDAEFEGTGIGLATVGRIVQRHGGRVWAEGEAGKGACFYVELPLANEEAQAA